MKGRGEHTWDNVKAFGMSPRAASLPSPRPNRLHVHVPADRTSNYAYLPAVGDFLDFAEEFDCPLGNPREVDAALADALAWRCYHDNKSLGQGKNMLFGTMQVFPENERGYPQSRRALDGWKKVEIQGEGRPVPWEGLHGIAQDMCDHGDSEAADIVEIMADTGMRESDWTLIAPEDISASADFGVTVFLGNPRKGERTKTGVRQGVRVDRDGIAARLLMYKKRAQRSGDKKVFRVTARQFWAAWIRACRRLGYNPGPPHSLRHTCASFDMLEQGPELKAYRTIQQVQARGRWANDKSVLRYGKTHVYVQALGEVPAHVAALGARRARAVGCRPRFARE